MRAKVNPRPGGSVNSGISLDDFLSRLDKVKKLGDKYMARCPAHEDCRPSLQIKQGDRGIMVRCYAGCDFQEIVFAMDLRPQDLFYDSLTEERRDNYRYQYLLDELYKINLVLYFYQKDMEDDLLSDEQLEKYRNTIVLKNELCVERDKIFNRLWP